MQTIIPLVITAVIIELYCVVIMLFPKLLKLFDEVELTRKLFQTCRYTEHTHLIVYKYIICFEFVDRLAKKVLWQTSLLHLGYFFCQLTHVEHLVITTLALLLTKIVILLTLSIRVHLQLRIS